MNTTPSTDYTRSFVDPDQYQAAVRGGDSLYTLIKRGTFRAELTDLDVGQMKLQYGRETMPRLAASGMPPNKVGVLVWLGDGLLPVVRGAQIQPGELMCLAPGMQSYHRTFGRNEFVTLTLDVGNLAQAGHNITGREPVLSPGGVLRPPEQLFARLRSTVQSTIYVSETAPQVFTSNGAVEALEQALLRSMLACLELDGARREGVPSWRRVVLAKRLLEAIEANPDRPWASHELCRIIGISERSLRKLCHEQLGISPLRFLALRRLHLARQALLRADRHSTTVTTIATELGIWELGRFAVAYKALFGEAPSVTLHRQGTAP